MTDAAQESLSQDKRSKFETRLKNSSEHFKTSARWWSFAHHSTLFLSIISTSAAALIPQLKGYDENAQKNLASLLAGLAAVLLGISTAGGFERKWRANRISSGETRGLQTELEYRDPTPADWNKLKEIDSVRNKAIIGG